MADTFGKFAAKLSALADATASADQLTKIAQAMAVELEYLRDRLTDMADMELSGGGVPRGDDLRRLADRIAALFERNAR